MKFLTSAEGKDWLALARQPAPDDVPSEWGYHDETRYRVPTDSGKKTALARSLAAVAADAASTGLLWITGYGIWPSSENQALYYALRNALGDERALRDAPCHLFMANEVTQFECLLDLVLYFFWDATVYLPGGGVILLLSNDEYLDVVATSSSNLISVSLILDRLKLDEA